jgi:DNA-binding MarR family transcriptional regulator
MKNSNPSPIGRLLVNNSRLQASRMDQLMDRIGLFRGQAILLVLLSEGDGLTHSEISRSLQISPAAATKVIKRLEELQFLQRRSDPSDERISRVFLLDEGRAVLSHIHSAFRKINQAILDGFSLEEEQALRGFLLRIHSNLQEVPLDGFDSPGLHT